jgi:hypothetical protein
MDLMDKKNFLSRTKKMLYYSWISNSQQLVNAQDKKLTHITVVLMPNIERNNRNIKYNKETTWNYV